MRHNPIATIEGRKRSCERIIHSMISFNPVDDCLPSATFMTAASILHRLQSTFSALPRFATFSH
jgi:hypothetical protein